MQEAVSNSNTMLDQKQLELNDKRKSSELKSFEIKDLKNQISNMEKQADDFDYDVKQWEKQVDLEHNELQVLIEKQ